MFLELPCELIDKIDHMNNIGDRSLFITYLLKKQMENKTFEVDENNEFTTKMRDTATSFTGEIGIIRSDGSSLGKFNINVNAVAPGMVMTEMAKNIPPEFLQKAIDETVLGRIATTEDIANLVVFLCSEKARHITGEIIKIDGGQYI